MCRVPHTSEMVNSGKPLGWGHLPVCPMGSAQWGDVGGSQQWLWGRGVTPLCAGGHRVMVGGHGH